MSTFEFSIMPQISIINSTMSKHLFLLYHFDKHNFEPLHYSIYTMDTDTSLYYLLDKAFSFSHLNIGHFIFSTLRATLEPRVGTTVEPTLSIKF